MNIENFVCLLVFAVMTDSVIVGVYEEWVEARLLQFKAELCTLIHDHLKGLPKNEFYFREEFVQFISATQPTLQGNDDSIINFVCNYKCSAMPRNEDREDDQVRHVNTTVSGNIIITLHEVKDKRPSLFLKFNSPSVALSGVLEVHIEGVLQKGSITRLEKIQLNSTAESGTELHAKYYACKKIYYAKFSILLDQTLIVI